jgi:hypothetical protein
MYIFIIIHINVDGKNEGYKSYILGPKEYIYFTILKTSVSTVVLRHLFTKSPYISSKSTQRKMLKSGAGGGLC